MREGNRSGFGSRILFEQTAQFDPPGKGDHIQNILAEEKEIIGNGDQGIEIVGNESGSS